MLQSATVILLFLLTSLYDCSIEKGWKGIEVFKSKRDDVEKELGKPFKDEGAALYQKDDVVVRIVYSTIPCTPATFGRGEFNLPPETVISYSVAIGQGIPLSKFEWKKADYARWVDDHRPGQVHYFNSKARVRFTTFPDEKLGEIVRNIEFERTPEQDEKYKCN